MSLEGKKPVTLEDLLRLKRAERPAPEFWERFDRELRAKQLAALVQKRPWWRGLTPSLTGFRRYQIPLGAAAALVITFVTVRQQQSTSATVAPALPRQTQALSTEERSEPVRQSALEPLERSARFHPQVDETLAAVEAPVGVEPARSDFSEVIPLFAGTIDALSSDDASPSARYIAANLAAAESASTRVLLGKIGAFEARAIIARNSAVEPLQQMASPSEIRLARYRSPLVATIAGEPADDTGERMARRLSEERLYDQISRIGARGDRVRVRF